MKGMSVNNTFCIFLEFHPRNKFDLKGCLVFDNVASAYCRISFLVDKDAVVCLRNNSLRPYMDWLVSP